MRVSSAVGRRLVAAAAAAAFAKLPVLPLLAGPDQFSLSALVVHAAYAAEKPTAANEYVDQEYGVSFVVPSGWSPEESELSGGRKLLAATDPADTDFNLFVAFTPIRGDYTSLGSFGNIDFVGSTILPQCPNGACTLETDGIRGKMIAQSTGRGAYIFDYLIEQTGQPSRRLRTLFSVQTVEGRGQNLITLTAQCRQERYDELSTTLREIVDSFRYVST